MILKKTLFLAAVMFTVCLSTFAGELQLCKDGKAEYGIQFSKTASAVDQFAVQELQKHLTAMSGATFAATQNKPAGKTIFVGLSPEAMQILGKDCLIQQLKDQDTVIQSKNGHLFLYGKGRHGNLYAVYELLENQLGCRWLSGFGNGDYIPSKKTITVSDSLKKSSYALPRRALMNWFYRDKDTYRLYAYRNRQNLLLNIGTPHNGIIQDVDLKGPGVHVLSTILPGFTKRYNKASSLFKIQDYFAIHPEWFSLDEHGKRVNNRQVCFTNKELRKELTKNLMAYYADLEKKANAKYFHTLDLNDIAYNMCYCKECQALQKKYQTPGGSFFDYLFELCETYPDKEFVTLAYQKSLTQKAPVGFKKYPKNLTIIFAPINGYFTGTFDKENTEDRTDLENWLKITPKVWIWYYPNTYNSPLPISAPAGGFKRIASDIRTMARLKVDGSYFEHDGGGASSGTNLTEMQSYVMYKLFQNPALDEKELMKDFAVHYYGKAADLVMQFVNEMEKSLDDFVAKGGFGYYSFQKYPYLTEKNFIRWNALLDEASKKIDPAHKVRIDLLRMGLDCCIVDHQWLDQKYEPMVKACKERLLQTARYIDKNHKVVSNVTKAVKKFLEKIDARGFMKPVPQELLAKYPADAIKVLLPAQNAAPKLRASDPDANQKFALVESWNGKKFSLGTYSPGSKRYGPGLAISGTNVVKGKYTLYKLNKTTTLPPDMFVWGGQWGGILRMGQYCRQDDPKSLSQEWDIYVSLKFTDDKVYMDRGFLVKADASLAMKPIPQELLSKYPAADIKVLLPSQSGSKKYQAVDMDANQNFALVEPWNGKKFTLGTYAPKSKSYGPGRAIFAENIVKGKYSLYKLNNSTTLKPDMFVWGGQWGLILRMGEYCKADDPKSLSQKWDIYVSLKFTDDKVYMDRGFLVKAK